MSETILKTLSDLCLYFAVVGAFPLFFTRDVLLLLPGLICAGATGVAASFQSKPWSKGAALATSVCSLLFADSMIELLILAPAVVYTVLVIYKGEFGLEYYTYRESFLRMLTALGVFTAIIFALGYFEGMTGNTWTSFDITTTTFYALLYAFTGIFLLRQLRLGADCQDRDRRRNNIQMLVVLAVILVLTIAIVAAEDVLHELIKQVFHWIMVIVGFPMMIIHWIMTWFVKDEGAGYMETVSTTQTEPHYVTDFTVLHGHGTTEQQVVADAGYPWWLAVLILAVMLGVLIFLLRSFRASTAGSGSRQEAEEVELEDQPFRPVRRSNRSKIRKLYRSYLKQQRKRGVRLTTTQTSLDILNAAPENTNPEAAARLRQLYLRARYSSEAQITQTDVDNAKEALRQI